MRVYGRRPMNEPVSQSKEAVATIRTFAASIGLIVGVISKLVTTAAFPAFPSQATAMEFTSWIAAIAGASIAYSRVLVVFSSMTGAISESGGHRRALTFAFGVASMLGACTSSFLYVAVDRATLRIGKDVIASATINSEMSHETNHMLLSNGSLWTKLRTADEFEEAFHPDISNVDARKATQEVPLGNALLILHGITIMLIQVGIILLAASCIPRSALRKQMIMPAT